MFPSLPLLAGGKYVLHCILPYVYNVLLILCCRTCLHSHFVARNNPVLPTPDSQSKQSKLGLPLPLLTQVQIHSQPKSNRRQYLTTIRDDTPSPEHRSNVRGQKRPFRKKRKHQQKVDRKLPGPPELSTEDRLEISVKIEKKK